MKKIIYWSIILLLLVEASLHGYSFFLKKHPGNSAVVAGAEYIPYTLYKHRYLNITPVYPRRPVIWCFGGSTMVGGYARSNKRLDQHKTFTVVLHEMLLKKGYRYSIRNFGQIGYVFNQERIFFFELLRRSPPPDMVIFLDGVNEFGVDPQRIGYPMKHINDMFQRLYLGMFSLSVEQHELVQKRFKTLYIIEHFFNAPRRLPYVVVNDSDPLNLTPRLGEGTDDLIIANYKFNVRLIENVCKEYGVRPMFVWQPVLFRKNALSPEEQPSRGFPFANFRKDEHKKISDLHNRVYDKVRNDLQLRTKRDFLYLGDIFRDCPRTIFFDYCHIDEDTIGHQRLIMELVSALERNKMLER